MSGGLLLAALGGAGKGVVDMADEARKELIKEADQQRAKTLAIFTKDLEIAAAPKLETAKSEAALSFSEKNIGRALEVKRTEANTMADITATNDERYTKFIDKTTGLPIFKQDYDKLDTTSKAKYTNEAGYKQTLDIQLAQKKAQFEAAAQKDVNAAKINQEYKTAETAVAALIKEGLSPDIGKQALLLKATGWDSTKLNTGEGGEKIKVAKMNMMSNIYTDVYKEAQAEVSVDLKFKNLQESEKFKQYEVVTARKLDKLMASIDPDAQTALQDLEKKQLTAKVLSDHPEFKDKDGKTNWDKVTTEIETSNLSPTAQGILKGQLAILRLQSEPTVLTPATSPAQPVKQSVPKHWAPLEESTGKTGTTDASIDSIYAKVKAGSPLSVEDKAIVQSLVAKKSKFMRPENIQRAQELLKMDAKL